MPQERLHFHEELSGLEQRALDGLGMVQATLDRTLAALSEHDLSRAEEVVAGDDQIDHLYLEVHEGVLSLIARQTTVATDLRVVAALLHVIGHVERMGDQCVNIAKLIPLAGEPPEDDAGILALVCEMGDRAGRLVGQAKRAFAERDVALAEELVVLDDEIDGLNRDSFPLAMRLKDDAPALEWSMRMVQVARWIERIGDHAVDIGEQTAFVVTGLFREFTDASHPELGTAQR